LFSPKVCKPISCLSW